MTLIRDLIRYRLKGKCCDSAGSGLCWCGKYCTCTCRGCRCS